jgi:hypothetical protein
MGMELESGGTTGAPCHRGGGHKYKYLVLQVGGSDPRLMILICEILFLHNLKKEEGYVSRKGCLPMMMMMVGVVLTGFMWLRMGTSSGLQ